MVVLLNGYWGVVTVTSATLRQYLRYVTLVVVFLRLMYAEVTDVTVHWAPCSSRWYLLVIRTVSPTRKLFLFLLEVLPVAPRGGPGEP